jgi:hypothetical protein
MKVESRLPHQLRKLNIGLLFLFGLIAFSTLYTGGAVVHAESASHGTVPAGGECKPEGGGAIRCKLVGRVESMPGGDMTGLWVVGGESFIVTENTELRAEHGPLAVDACVAVHYDFTTVPPYGALLIKTKPSDDCDGGGDHGDHEAEVKGVIDALPGNVFLLGEWTVDGASYIVDAQTVFMNDKSQYTVGACVEIKYDSITSIAYRVKLDADCNGDGGGGGGGDHGNHDEFRGAIDSLPANGLIGVWIVRGTEFDVTSDTRLESEYGAFVPGLCVEIKYDPSTTPYTALKIEGKRGHECGNPGDGDHVGEGELYGLLQAFPADLIGEWQIGGLAFQADSSTKFDQEHGPFKVGAIVKVKFYTTVDGINHAKEIEVKYEGDGCDHGDDHGSHEGAEGNAYGAIDSFPAGMVGDWVIGGLTYTADASTRFEQEHGQFAQGAWVKVKYHLDANDNRIADKIKTENEHAGGQDWFKLVGFVESTPATGFIGEWVVGGETFVADARTQFEEEHGLLVVGAYVELKYTLVNGVKTLHEIHTEVPPGAGDMDDIGEIEDMGAPTAADASAVSTWRIDGQNYVVNDATRLDDGATPLVVGSTVAVNSYTATDGSLVATSVTGVEINHQVFLPLATSR